MVQIKEIQCPHCNSSRVVNNGKKRNGSQNILCKRCGKQFQTEYYYWGADKSNRELALKMLLRGSGIRDCSSVLGISCRCVLGVLRRNAEKLEIKPRHSSYHKVQIDEQWGYVGAKKRKYG